MKLEEQSKLASEFTNKLLKYIQSANKKLNKDHNGCYIEYLDISNGTNDTTVTVRFKSLLTEVKSFTCSAREYDY